MGRAALLALALVLLPAGALAHRASDSHLTLVVEGAAVTGRWDIALRDLEQAIGLDADGDGRLLWGELRVRAAELGELALGHLALRADGALCRGSVSGPLVDRRDDAAYAVLDLSFRCPSAPRELQLEYTLFAELDPLHRGLVRFESAAGAQAAIVGGDSSRAGFVVAAPDALGTLLGYAGEGVWHIWIGFDHLLFLLCLVLPVLCAEPDPLAGGGARAAALRLLKLVSAFTLAHSLTLAPAALGLLHFPARWVESLIAASVVVVALANLAPGRRVDGPKLAFGFGLVHGLGFAGVLAELGLPAGALLPALLGFNIGVELGQLVVLAGVAPALHALRRFPLYQRRLLPVGSLAIAGVGLVWLFERALALELVDFL